MDVKPPAWNKGVPIVVNRVRPGWKWPTRGGALIQPGGWEQGKPRESNAKLLLDLRAEMPGERAAEQRLLTLFYATRRIVDAAGALVVAKDRTPWELSTFEAASDFETLEKAL